MAHVPFRASKLTMVLRDSFVRPRRVAMIACVGPSVSCTDHTSSLRYTRPRQGKARHGSERRRGVRERNEEPKEVTRVPPLERRNSSETAVAEART